MTLCDSTADVKLRTSVPLSPWEELPLHTPSLTIAKAEGSRDAEHWRRQQLKSVPSTGTSHEPHAPARYEPEALSAARGGLKSCPWPVVASSDSQQVRAEGVSSRLGRLRSQNGTALPSRLH